MERAADLRAEVSFNYTAWCWQICIVNDTHDSNRGEIIVTRQNGFDSKQDALNTARTMLRELRDGTVDDSVTVIS